MHLLPRYSKTPLSISGQIRQLSERGLRIDDPEQAYWWLENVSYYRLAGYWWPMQSDKANHIFKENSSFNSVIQLYLFDRDLRSLLFKSIEIIEVSFRTRLVYEFSLRFHQNWYEDPSLFIHADRHEETMRLIMKELRRKNPEEFIREHLKKYSFDPLPPSWKTLEILSLGNISTLYSNFKDVQAKNKIAFLFNLPDHTDLVNWIHVITNVRNLCAHHSRVWNSKMPVKVKLPSGLNGWINKTPNEIDLAKAYLPVCAVNYLLKQISSSYNIAAELKALFSAYPEVDPSAMGFITFWETEELWTDR